MPHSNPNFYDAIVAGISSSQDHWGTGSLSSSYVAHIAGIIYGAISTASSNVDAEAELLQSIVGGLFSTNPMIPSLDPNYSTVASAINTLFEQLRVGLDPTSSGGAGTQGFQGFQGGGGGGGGGTQGPQGKQGFQGSTGSGTQGNQGNVGSGTQGAQGNVGSGTQGAQGAQGNVGSGTQGNQGAQGNVGSGTQGNQGAQGNVGSGTQGTQGSQGSVGSGTQGTQGSQGSVGSGTQGNQGAQGNVGSGTQGNQGAQGDVGSGTQGAQGDGYQGPQGDTGSQGFQGSGGGGGGYQGPQGWQGSGNQGVQGFQGPSGGGGGVGGTIYVGSVSGLPDPAGLPDGTLYIPTDDTTQLVNIDHNWNLLIPGAVPIPMSVGDISGWTYESGIADAAILQAHNGYTRMTNLLPNSAPDYVDWLPPVPTLQVGAGGIWTIKMCTRYHPTDARGGDGNPYSSINIVLFDESDHRFMFGPQDSPYGPLLLSASACGFSGHYRNYYGGLTSNNLHTSNGITWVRLRFDGTNYISEYSIDGATWSVSTVGGANIFNWGGGAIIPTRWGVGTQYIPNSLGIWDIYQLDQTPTNG